MRIKLGVDLGGTKTEIVALDEDGRVRLRRRRPTPRAYDDIVNNIAALVAEAQAELRSTDGAPTIGVGIPGSISPHTGLVRNANTQEMNGHPLDIDLASAIGREVRPALNGVLGTIGVLAESRLTESQRAQAVAVRELVENQMATLTDIIDLARLEDGRLRIQDEGFDLVELVEGLVETLAGQAAAKGIDLVAGVPAGVPSALRGDPKRLRQVLAILAGNAVKFTEQGGVSLTVTAPASAADSVTVRFEVADTGIGIPDAAQPHVFDGFGVGGAGAPGRHGGSGLQLAIAKRLVGLMGGAIGFDSAAGVGSRFWFTVPLAHRPDGAGPAEAASSLAGKRILLVEGNGVSREVLTRQLADWGAAVHGVASGRAALEVIASPGSRRPRGGAAFDTALVDDTTADLPVATLARRLRDAGADVRVAMTESAQQFVSATTFQAVSHHPVRTTLWDAGAEAAMGHIELARWATRIVVAPATANTLAKLAHGFADNLVTTLCLATTAPLTVCPAMNHRMWLHPATQANMALLRERGAQVIGPEDGPLAEGESGPGRLAEPAAIVAALPA